MTTGGPRLWRRSALWGACSLNMCQLFKLLHRGGVICLLHSRRGGVARAPQPRRHEHTRALTPHSLVARSNRLKAGGRREAQQRVFSSNQCVQNAGLGTQDTSEPSQGGLLLLQTLAGNNACLWRSGHGWQQGRACGPLGSVIGRHNRLESIAARSAAARTALAAAAAGDNDHHVGAAAPAAAAAKALCCSSQQRVQAPPRQGEHQP